MNAEQLKKLCGVCGNEHPHSEAVCEESLSACGACGEWSNSDSHNCSEEASLLECVDCLEMFDPFVGGMVLDGFNAPALGGVVVSFCGKCWKKEIARRNGRNN